MNDRAVSILDNYDFTVSRTYKVRGAFVCETDCGLKILKEYRAPVSKLGLMDALIADKEGKFISYDREGMGYVVKNYYEGRECEPKTVEDLKAAMRSMALLHEALVYPEEDMPEDLRRYDLEEDIVRQNKGLKKIRSFIRSRGRKTEFELQLLDAYNLFLAQAVKVEERVIQEDFTAFYEEVEKRRQFVHGDFQYHNILLGKEKAAIINFEKCRKNFIIPMYRNPKKNIVNPWLTEITFTTVIFPTMKTFLMKTTGTSFYLKAVTVLLPLQTAS